MDYLGNPITSFELPVATMYEQENEKYMSIFKKMLSGQIGQTLTPLAYPVQDDDLLPRVRDTALNDEDALQELFTKLIAGIRAEHHDMQSVEDAQNADKWLILLMHDNLDVRKRDVNGEIDYENSDRAFSYILCAICPVKQEKTALRYDPTDSIFHQRAPEWLASAPVMGSLFPLYEGGAADVNTILFFSKDAGNGHDAFLKAVFVLIISSISSDQSIRRAAHYHGGHPSGYEVFPGKGIAMGNQTSQWFVLFYLDPLDRLVKEKLRIRYYTRYMDDCILIHHSKDILQQALLEMRELLKSLHLSFNEKTQIFPISHGVEYLGWRFYLTDTGAVVRRLKKHSKSRWKHRLKKLRNLYACGEMEASKIRESIQSYQNHMSYGNTGKLYNRVMSQYVLRRTILDLPELRPRFQTGSQEQILEQSMIPCE